jgi:hypothetical protein
MFEYTQRYCRFSFWMTEPRTWSLYRRRFDSLHIQEVSLILFTSTDCSLGLFNDELFDFTGLYRVEQ